MPFPRWILGKFVPKKILFSSLGSLKSLSRLLNVLTVFFSFFYIFFAVVVSGFFGLFFETFAGRAFFFVSFGTPKMCSRNGLFLGIHFLSLLCSSWVNIVQKLMIVCCVMLCVFFDCFRSESGPNLRDPVTSRGKVTKNGGHGDRVLSSGLALALLPVWKFEVKGKALLCHWDSCLWRERGLFFYWKSLLHVLSLSLSLSLSQRPSGLSRVQGYIADASELSTEKGKFEQGRGKRTLLLRRGGGWLQTYREHYHPRPETF